MIYWGLSGLYRFLSEVFLVRKYYAELGTNDARHAGQLRAAVGWRKQKRTRLVHEGEDGGRLPSSTLKQWQILQQQISISTEKVNNKQGPPKSESPVYFFWESHFKKGKNGRPAVCSQGYKQENKQRAASVCETGRTASLPAVFNLSSYRTTTRLSYNRGWELPSARSKRQRHTGKHPLSLMPDPAISLNSAPSCTDTSWIAQERSLTARNESSKTTTEMLSIYKGLKHKHTQDEQVK